MVSVTNMRYGHITADDEGTHCHCSTSISLLIIAPTIFEPTLSTWENFFLQKPKNISFDINVEVDGGYAVKRTLVTSDKFSTRGQNLHFNALFVILQRTAPKTWYVLAIIPQLILKYPAGKFIQDEASK